MKKFIAMMVSLACLFLSACGENISKITPSSYEKGAFGEQLEKRPIRMINVNGELYYDSSLASDMTPRCGTLDGGLKKTVKDNEIPLKSGEANFEIDGYQSATSITKEINIDGEWVIFKKYDTYGRTLDGLKYCYYIKGHLNNAAIDSEIIVLSAEEDVTFNDVFEPLLSSQASVEAGIGKTLHNPILHDKWGIFFYADDVTPTGLTLQIEQFGGNPTGDLQTGSFFSLEKSVDNEWQEIEMNRLINWHSIAYIIKKNDITELEVDWEFTHGKLEPGFYRLHKKVMDFRAAGDFDEDTYEVYFTIE